MKRVGGALAPPPRADRPRPPPPPRRCRARRLTPRRPACGNAPPRTPPSPRPPQRERDVAAFLASPDAGWLGSLPDAPLFTPTAEEWADPIAYLRSIAPAAAGAGIARIAPPLAPAVPAPAVLGARRGWRYGARQQFLGGAPWRSFGEGKRLLFDAPK
jgi:hypothetical protein